MSGSNKGKHRETITQNRLLEKVLRVANFTTPRPERLEMLREVVVSLVEKPLAVKCVQPNPKDPKKLLFSESAIPSYQRDFRPGNIKEDGPRQKLVLNRLNDFSGMIRTLVQQLLKGREYEFIKATYWDEGKIEFPSDDSRRNIKAETFKQIRDELLWNAEFWIKDCRVGEFSFESRTPLVQDRVRVIDGSGVEMQIEAK